MPTYAYACKDCSHAFEIVQSFTDSSLTSCPECQGTLRKKFNSVGVVFKGSGFYRTDSRDAKGSTVSPAPAPDPGRSSGARRRFRQLGTSAVAPAPRLQLLHIGLPAPADCVMPALAWRHGHLRDPQRSRDACPLPGHSAAWFPPCEFPRRRLTARRFPARAAPFVRIRRPFPRRRSGRPRLRKSAGRGQQDPPAGHRGVAACTAG